ncbi:MAG: NlpC/P60 family protein [Bacteroidales bacterium]|nr:NlpC/P60 family protein [Bacteroidales bacterium]
MARILRHIAVVMLLLGGISAYAQDTTSFVSPAADTTALAHPVFESNPDSLCVDAAKLADDIVETALKYLGYPYVWAANGPNAFDCTGFTSFIYRQFGYKLGRMAGAQAKNGRAVEGDMSNFQKGDIIIFAGPGYRNYFGHAGIVIGMDEDGKNLKFIHAACAKAGVVISSTAKPHYHERFAGLRRIIPDAVSSHLGEGENVLSSGTWSYESEDDKAAGEAYVLNSDGTWSKTLPQQIVVPDGTRRYVAPAPQKTVSDEDDVTDGNGASTAQYYTIKSGDTLSGIASRHRTTVGQLCKLNGMKTTTVLKIGKRIRVR